MTIPGTMPTTISNLQRGDTAALFPHSNILARVRRVTPHTNNTFWITWDHGPNTKRLRRLMPGSNPVQVA